MGWGVECTECEGTGFVACEHCDGEGEVDENPCEECGGEGQFTCEDCGGKGGDEIGAWDLGFESEEDLEDNMPMSDI